MYNNKPSLLKSLRHNSLLKKKNYGTYVLDSSQKSLDPEVVGPPDRRLTLQGHGWNRDKVGNSCTGTRL